MSLLPPETEHYTALIDRILASSDLQTISMKQIRKRLQALLPDVDINEKKQAVQQLIHDRFDLVNTAEPPPVPRTENSTNGYERVKKERATKQESTPPTSSRAVSSPPPKSEPDSEDQDDESPPPKKMKKTKESDDAKLAAMLQAQENRAARATRGGNKKVTKKAPKKPRKKSEKKIKADDDSDLEEIGSDGQVKEKPKKGGFHKQYYLSAPLADLVNETKLSRPQVVKKIWEYIKARELQDPSDKRQIMCDEKLQLVFKTEKVHMFTMNKLLGKQLYDIEDEPEVEMA